jgi:hypothetical protein
VAVSLIDARNLRTQRKTPTCRKSLVKIIIIIIPGIQKYHFAKKTIFNETMKDYKKKCN